MVIGISDLIVLVAWLAIVGVNWFSRVPTCGVLELGSINWGNEGTNQKKEEKKRSR